MTEEQLVNLKAKAIEIRINILRMLTNARSGHTGGSLSAVEMLLSLYDYMNHRPDDPNWKGRDRFVLSKGHAAPALYAVLASCGYFPREKFDKLRKIDGELQGHPYIETSGVEISTGSLGQGLSIANGMALAARLDNKTSDGTANRRIYAIIGDGESQEGQIWEAAMTAAHNKLDNLCVFLDNNRLQIDGCLAKIMNIEPIKDKWEAFGWYVIEVDGHDFAQIMQALEKAEAIKDKPTLIWAKTVKGKGGENMEDNVKYHGNPPSKKDFENAKEKLIKTLEKLHSDFPEIITSDRVEQIKSMGNPASYNKPEATKEGETASTRKAYGKTLADLGYNDERIVALDADLSCSTQTAMFGKAFGENSDLCIKTREECEKNREACEEERGKSLEKKRFFNMGVAEQDMIGTAAGLAVSGKIPFASTFAIFASGRAWEQIRQSVCYSNLNVKIVATHGGITVGEDGATHHATEDLALMRVLPNMTVIVPSDYHETTQAVIAAANHKGPCYIRLSRPDTPVINEENTPFEIGKARILREGTDVTLIGIGLMVAVCLKAAQLLAEEGISARVVNMSTLKSIPSSGD
jgi:transketolase